MLFWLLVVCIQCWELAFMYLICVWYLNRLILKMELLRLSGQVDLQKVDLFRHFLGSLQECQEEHQGKGWWEAYYNRKAYFFSTMRVPVAILFNCFLLFVLNKQVEATLQLPVDDAVISESTPIAETILTASNETLVNMLSKYLMNNASSIFL